MKKINMFSKTTFTTFLLAAAISLAAGQNLLAQCVPCPAGATDSAVGVGLAAFFINPDGSTGTVIGSSPVGSCQCIRLRMSVSYVPFGPSGGTTADFSGGQMVIQSASGSFVDNVTPAGGVPIIGAQGTTCNGSPVTPSFLSTFTTDFCVSNHLADIVANKITFQALYGPQGTIAYFCPPITNQTSGQTPIQINIAPPPTCTVTPATNSTCPGGSATFTVNPTGTAPFTFSWTGPNGFTSTNQTITISNATLSNAGVYTATVHDFFGCPTTCSGTLIVFTPPVCSVSPQNATNCLDSNPCGTTFTVTITGGTAPFTNIVTGPGYTNTIVSTTGTFTFTPCASNTPNVYTVFVTDAHGCTTSCQSTLYGINCRPQIGVFKQVVCYSNACEPFDSNLSNQKSATGVSFGSQCPAFCYRITVTNAGDVTLSNLVVSDVSSPGPNLNLSGCGFPSTLPVGGSASCVVQDVSRCANDTNVVTATAIGVTGVGTTGTVTAMDTNRVTVIPINIACALTVSTNNGATFFAPAGCASQYVPGSYIVRITVTNNGSFPLQNVMLTGSGFDGCFTSPLNIGNLNTNASFTINCTNSCSTVSSNFFSVNVSGQASQSVGHICAYASNGVPVTASSSCNTCVQCLCVPGIAVFKQVLCYSNMCEPFSSDLTSQKSATGVSFDGQCPAFCYRITVTNTGTCPLTNLVVSDSSVPGPNLNLSGCSFPSTLAVGGTASCIIPDVTRCSNDVNVVTASAAGQISVSQSSTVTASDTNRVTIIPINVACALTVSTNNGATFFAPSGCAAQYVPGSYIVRITVTNNGSFPLQNVTLTSVAGFAGCFSSPLNIGNLNTNASFSVNCTNSCSTVSSNYFQVNVSAQASQSVGHICAFTSNSVPVTATSSCNTCVQCLCVPGIAVFKQVVCYSNMCEPFSSDLNSQKSATGVSFDGQCPAFCYRITVTNTGTCPLTNLVVSDVSVPGPNLNLSGCNFPSTLAVGGTASCIIPDVSRCASDVNVVTATAVGQVSVSQSQTVTATDTNRVTVIPINVACALTVSTNNGASFFAPAGCATQLIPNSYIVRITVTNSGSFPLQNVTVTSVAGFAGCFNSPLNLGNLNTNASTSIDCTNTCSSISSNYFAVNISAQASQSLGHICAFTSNGVPVTATSSCNTCVLCTGCPRINVTKGIACVICTSNETGIALECASFNGQFNHDAFGVRSDTQEPAFCYDIVVTNSGQVALVNVSVIDDHFGVLTNNVFLPVGGAIEFRMFTNWVAIAPTSGSYVVTNTVTASSTNTAYISCPFVDANGAVSANSSAVAHVKPASIACEKFVSVNGSAPAHSFTLTTNGIASNIVWSVTITNDGQADLANVVVTDEGSPQALPCNFSITIPGIFPVGASTNFVVCTNGFSTCTNLVLDNTIHVVALAAAEGTNCVWDINGSNITSQSSCPATLNLLCVVPNACRVTGGGRQDLPTVCPTDVRYVTHGGQVGAPVGNKVCFIDTNLPSFFLGNPCIHGRWTHVRHQQGGGEGNFHARFFDTLDCACLDTNLNPFTCQYGPGTVINGVCNPGDRLSGPEPRKAPANKIAFTGVGDWTCEKGGREPRSCLFRVDIEDRGEPGNDHVLDLGHKPNRIPDRYRIRIWVLTDLEKAELNGAGPDPYLLHFRDCISACNGIDYQDGGLCGANSCSGDTCTGAGATGTVTFPGGCPVRTPNIDDGGELLHGNHQIHPAIMTCDPFNPTGPGLAKP